MSTTNIIERLFPPSDYVLTDRRKPMFPIMLEAITFLKLNWIYWVAQDLATAMKAKLPANLKDKDGDEIYKLKSFLNIVEFVKF